MYKIFLCLRYLKSRIIAWFAVLAVTLCVAMLVIVISVMNGFLNKIEQAAKGLFGDVVLQGSSYGLSHYEEFVQRVLDREEQIEAGSPVVFTIGVLRKPGNSLYKQQVQVVGIDLPDRAMATDFEKGLVFQDTTELPTWDPTPAQLRARLEAIHEQTKQALEKTRAGTDETGGYSDETALQLQHLSRALQSQQGALFQLETYARNQEQIQKLEARVEQLRDQGASVLEIGELQDQIFQLRQAGGLTAYPDRVILGSTIQDMAFRTTEGTLIPVLSPPQRVFLYVIPVELLAGGSALGSGLPPAVELSVVDYCQTGVYNVDSSFVYIPLKLAQQKAKMTDPARVSQIHFKVKAGNSDEQSLRELAARIERHWDDFRMERPDEMFSRAQAMTWRQMQSHIIEPIESQRTLVVLMFGLISLVAVVLIFVIFYMIVLQKTKDIGILKAIGAGGWGVAGIFLLYGAVIGLLGSILGTILGYYFVIYINPIHDWLGEHLGFRVWRMETFMFDRIPNEMDWSAAGYVVLGAIVAGLLGALAPALRAARMQPVEALRYE
jgi:lipoprotein-releasing system permease protein